MERQDLVHEENEYDFVWSADALARQEHSNELANALIEGSAADVSQVGLLSRATLSGFDRIVAFQAVVPRPVEPIMAKWAFRLGDYLFNARAVLDHLMWVVAHDKPIVPLTTQEEKDLQFPICVTEQQWKSFAGMGVAKKIRQPVLSRIQAVQPFQRPNHPTSRGLDFMQRIHRYDKHRVPLKLALKLDMQFLPLFGARADFGDYEDEWLEFDQPVRDGLPLLRRRFVNRTPRPADETLNVAPVVSFEGEEYDLQDLSWDVTASLYRAVDGVSTGRALRADVFEMEVEWRRESLRTLRRSILRGTDEWERRGFDKPSSWSALIEELNKPDGDLTPWIREDGELGMPLAPSR